MTLFVIRAEGRDLMYHTTSVSTTNLSHGDWIFAQRNCHISQFKWQLIEDLELLMRCLWWLVQKMKFFISVLLQGQVSEVLMYRCILITKSHKEWLLSRINIKKKNKLFMMIQSYTLVWSIIADFHFPLHKSDCWWMGRVIPRPSLLLANQFGA